MPAEDNLNTTMNNDNGPWNGDGKLNGTGSDKGNWKNFVVAFVIIFVLGGVAVCAFVLHRVHSRNKVLFQTHISNLSASM